MYFDWHFSVFSTHRVRKTYTLYMLYSDMSDSMGIESLFSATLYVSFGVCVCVWVLHFFFFHLYLSHSFFKHVSKTFPINFWQLMMFLVWLPANKPTSFKASDWIQLTKLTNFGIDWNGSEMGCESESSSHYTWKWSSWIQWWPH